MVAGICQQIDLIGQIDRIVGPIGRKVSVGQAILATVLNDLGFVNRPLYLTPEFYANRPVEELIGAGISAEDLNYDWLGRALDVCYQVGITQTFVQVASHALWVMRIVARFANVDARAFHLEWAYVRQDDGGEGVPIGTVKSRLARARLQMPEKLSQDFDFSIDLGRIRAKTKA